MPDFTGARWLLLCNPLTAWAEIKRGIKRLHGRLTNVRTDLLTARERQENADALARLSMMREVTRKVTRGVGQLALTGTHGSDD